MEAEANGRHMVELQQANLYKGTKKLKNMVAAPLEEEDAHLIQQWGGRYNQKRKERSKAERGYDLSRSNNWSIKQKEKFLQGAMTAIALLFETLKSRYLHCQKKWTLVKKKQP